MKDYQESFLKLAIKSKSLQFGEFTLKSGRSSPYFFNAANMLSSCSLYELAKCYVDAIEDKNLNFDCIYGPAYKGIFLGSIVATLFSEQGNNYPLAFLQYLLLTMRSLNPHKNLITQGLQINHFFAQILYQ